MTSESVRTQATRFHTGISQAATRLRIFIIWVAFWVLASIVMLLTPSLRSDESIGDEQTLPALLSLCALWLPPLSTFAAFWFPADEQQESRRRRISKDKVAAAYTITAAYLFFVTLLIVHALLISDYDFGLVELPEGASFEERIASSVQLGLLMNPLAVAPIAWLTRTRSKHGSTES